LIRFTIAVTIAAIALFAGGNFAFETKPLFFFQTIGLLVVSTTGLYKFLIDMKRDKPELFVHMYLATLGIKLIAYATYLVFMAKRQPEMTVENVVFFLIGYVIFTGVETTFLYRYVNQPDKL
jgi:tellurite resistance protein TehA-like permease